MSSLFEWISFLLTIRTARTLVGIMMMESDSNDLTVHFPSPLGVQMVSKGLRNWTQVLLNHYMFRDGLTLKDDVRFRCPMSFSKEYFTTEWNPISTSKPIKGNSISTTPSVYLDNLKMLISVLLLPWHVQYTLHVKCKKERGVWIAFFYIAIL